jgi:hypothetical protein
MLAPTRPEIKSQPYALHYGSARTPIALVVPDSVMYRIRWPSGELSDMVNLSRAKDAVVAICERGPPRRDPRLFNWKIDPPREARKGIPGAFERPPSRRCANMKPAHLTRREVSRRLDRKTGRWRPAGASTVMLEAMLKALARQSTPRSTPESPRSTPGSPRSTSPSPESPGSAPPSSGLPTSTRSRSGCAS